MIEAFFVNNLNDVIFNGTQLNMKIGLKGLHNIFTHGSNIAIDKQQNSLIIKSGSGIYHQLDYIDKDYLNDNHFIIDEGSDEATGKFNISINTLSSVTELNYIDTFRLNIIYDKLILNGTTYIRSNINKLCWININGQKIYQDSAKLNPIIGDSLYTDINLTDIAGTVSEIVLNNTYVYTFVQSQPGSIYLSDENEYIRNRQLDIHEVFAWTNLNSETVYTNKYNTQQIYLDNLLTTISNLYVTAFKVPKWITDNAQINYFNNNYSLININLENIIIDSIICDSTSFYSPYPTLFKSMFTHIFELQFDMNSYTQLDISDRIATANTVHTISKQYTENMYTKAQINNKLDILQRKINSNSNSSIKIPDNVLYFSYDDSVYEDEIVFQTDSTSGTLLIQ